MKSLVIRSTALLFPAQGFQVGVVRGGLRRSDAVILSPSDSLLDGAPVQVETGGQQ